MEMNDYIAERGQDVFEKKLTCESKYLYLKRILDIILSFVSILVLMPFFLLCILLILVTDGRPVFFKQQRVGQFEKLFICYKFRSMRRDTPLYVPTEKLRESEKYITPLGRILRRTSIDELPQLFNILKGDMSFIGPRPLIAQETEIHESRRINRIYALKPGLSGYAQVEGRDTVGTEEKVKLDRYYLDNISFALDLKILWKTIFVVFRQKGYKEG